VLAVAAAAAIAAATATVATTAAPASAAAASATAASAIPAASAATTTTAAPAAGLTLARLVHGERAAIERLAIELGNGGLRVFVVRELDEGEPARLTCHAVGYDADADDLPPTRYAGFTQRGFIGVIREVSYVDASSHASALPVRIGLLLRVFPGPAKPCTGKLALRPAP
jgi:hypothetical protein